MPDCIIRAGPDTKLSTDLVISILFMSTTQNLPEIVQIVLPRLARMRAARVLPLGAFEKKVQRLCAEEFAPRGQMLLFRELSDGRIRFIIKDRATHAFVHMVEYPSTATADRADAPSSARGVKTKHLDTTEAIA
jgi:hypothetical protein